jgi:hypothetical protein
VEPVDSWAGHCAWLVELVEDQRRGGTSWDELTARGLEESRLVGTRQNTSATTLKVLELLSLKGVLM